MEEMLELAVKYGFPSLISILFLWGAVDLYQALKKNWVPNFLRSFERIADSSEDTVTEIKHIGEILGRHESRLDSIEVKLDKTLAKIA